MRSRGFRRRLRSEELADSPDYALVGVVRIPELQQSPGRAIGKRVVFAVVALFATSIIVYLDRDGYRDVQPNPLSF
ncbi:potassium transporter Kef, partial [Streptomyces sp. SID10244]|nr:potassium transporter Kef [Streptomyces sp. SID10244]